MKKSLLVLSLTALLFSCKKTTTTNFTATDVTGTTLIKGTVTKNIITPNGGGGWINSNRIPAAGVLVQIKVNKNQLYPASIAQGADVYSATSDALGNWSMNVKSNATGVNAYMTIAGFNGTLDTLINNVTKVGLYANYFGTTSAPTLIMGTTYDWGVYNFTAANLTSNPNNIINIGTAIVSGSVSANLILKTVITGTAGSTVFGFTNMPVPAGVPVNLSLANDPTTLAPKLYTASTDATGHYTFSFPTVPNGTPGFAQNGNIWVSDYATSRDTIRIVNGVSAPTITGPTGVFRGTNNNQAGLFNNVNRNGTNMAYLTWVPN